MMVTNLWVSQWNTLSNPNRLSPYHHRTKRLVTIKISSPNREIIDFVTLTFSYSQGLLRMGGMSTFWNDGICWEKKTNLHRTIEDCWCKQEAHKKGSHWNDILPSPTQTHILHFNSTFICMRTMAYGWFYSHSRSRSVSYLFLQIHTENVLLFIEHRRWGKSLAHKLNMRIGRCEYVHSVRKNAVDGI